MTDAQLDTLAEVAWMNSGVEAVNAAGDYSARLKETGDAYKAGFIAGYHRSQQDVAGVLELHPPAPQDAPLHTHRIYTGPELVNAVAAKLEASGVPVQLRGQQYVYVQTNMDAEELWTIVGRSVFRRRDITTL